MQVQPTEFTFSKTFHANWNDPYFGELYDVGIYHLFSGSEEVGHFLVAGEGACFVLDEVYYYTKRIKKNLFGDTYAIKRFDTEEQVGLFRNHGFYNGAQSHGSVFFQHVEYISSIGVPDVRFSLFKRATWRHYKLLLVRKNAIEIAYDFQVDTFGGFGLGWTELAVNGKVAFGSSDLRIVLSGFYFIERMLAVKDLPV